MAKMFYTIEEASQKLGVTVDQLKQMASSGKLQQFRDRDKLMFKREQVDALSAASSSVGSGSGSSIGLESGPIPLKGSGDTDQVGGSTRVGRKEDPRQATGISVFDTEEVEHADPMAQTQVSQPPADQEEIALESVGSGSGLLDLTRESDDTSLGAELLDEIYPSSDGSGAGQPPASLTGSALMSGSDTVEGSGTGGIEHPAGSAMTSGMISYQPAAEPKDPAGSGFGAGILIGVTAILVILLIVVSSQATGVPAALTTAMAKESSTLLMWAGVMLVASLVLGLIGFFIGKASAK